MIKNYYHLWAALLLFAFSMAPRVHAQVENYCLRLSQGGQVDCGPMPELDGLDTYTVQFWMNADAWTDGATLLSRGDGFRVGLGGEKTLSVTAGGRTFTVTRNEFVPNRWIPIMLMVKGSRVNVYVDQTMVKAASTTAVMPSTGAKFILGGDQFKGRIDEVRVWNAELSSDYEFFTHNTLNKWTPQLGNLVAYFKMDQPWCENLVDYKPLFATRQKTNHHGILTATGAKKEKVTDNDGLVYILNGAYTNNIRFLDSSIEKEKYLLANDLIILGLQSYDDGHVKPLQPNDHATVRNGEYRDRYKNRLGVLLLSGTGSSLECPNSVFTPWSGYTVETWVYLDEWTEGAFIFRKENAAKTKGFSISLGNEADREVIVRIDGRKYVFQKVLQANRWAHLAVSPGGSQATVIVNASGTVFHPDKDLSDSSTDPMPTGMDNLKAYFGQNLKGALDESAVWHTTVDATTLAEHRNNKMPMPGPGKAVSGTTMTQANAFYRYNNPDNLGWDYYSQDEWKNIMESCYEGYTGYQIRISVQGHSTWQNTIADASKRKIFAADLAELSKPYAGVELDLEWMDGTQTNLGLLADEIVAALPKGKTLMISHHQYGAYQFPKEKISKVDGFTFQQYGPQNTWYDYPSFERGYNAFKNYGYPDNKIYLSYSTTTSGGYNESGSKVGEVIGYNWGIITGDYEPATDGSFERGVYKGLNYYFHGPWQVYNRTKFCRDHKLQGIFYWDMCNDLPTSHKYNLAKWSNYAACANVDPKVESVTINHPTGIGTVGQTGMRQADECYDLQGRRLSNRSLSNSYTKGVFIQNGKKILR